MELIKRAVSPLHAVAEAKKVILKEVYPQNSIALHIDPDKIVEAVRNVIDNAIKFSSKDDMVKIVVENEINPVLTISDQGPGIDPDVQKELFEKNRVWSGKVKASGAGLGLYLSKQFIELQGGTITYVTALGKGTIFTINFK